MVTVANRQGRSAGVFQNRRDFTVKDFRVLSLMAGGDQVAAEVVIEAVGILWVLAVISQQFERI
jgi:hypothetical protein